MLTYRATLGQDDSVPSGQDSPGGKVQTSVNPRGQLLVVPGSGGEVVFVVVEVVVGVVEVGVFGISMNIAM